MAKVNQLRDQQEYQWGDAFSKILRLTFVVRRDSVCTWQEAVITLSPGLGPNCSTSGLRYGLEVNW